MLGVARVPVAPELVAELEPGGLERALRGLRGGGRGRRLIRPLRPAEELLAQRLPERRPQVPRGAPQLRVGVVVSTAAALGVQRGRLRTARRAGSVRRAVAERAPALALGDRLGERAGSAETPDERERDEQRAGPHQSLLVFSCSSSARSFSPQAASSATARSRSVAAER